ncbi:ATP-dependent DNA helicase RecG [uncultured Corynebacterium sp.]|uniref:ATP-dependent DNA helicase RecG n=1 Tax=uncultured Corynebacterium sp. TaxID=159447 RepID=UPI0025FA2BC9|nr:ATP-dependent DNA helicase RecG [uncultured Corynebacterium sp.]
MLGWHDTRLLKDILPTKEAKAMEKALGYTTAGQLLRHHVRKYSHHGSGVDLGAAAEGDMVTIVGEVTQATKSYTSTGKMLYKIVVASETQRITISFFGARHVPALLPRGVRAMFTGKVKFFRNQPQLSHPEFIIIPSVESGGKVTGTGGMKALAAYGDIEEVARNLVEREYLPIYAGTATMTTWRIMAAVQRVLDTMPPIPEPLGTTPDGLPSFETAIRGVHNPGDEGPGAFIDRLKYNEALSLATVMALRRADTAARKAPPCPRALQGQQHALIDALPFPLTAGQKQVTREISSDMEQRAPMSRLLQGEVGSGKTIVSLLAMLQAIDSGRQCAMLAPTEVLATQHARSLTTTLATAGVTATVVLLTGSMPTAARREALLNVISGQADILVGTHALIQDSVEFFDLGLVVVDEQHRFGVEQRDRLRTKGREGLTPHLLVMTATPIPRTIAMTVFGDLAVSTLRELPGGRRPIQTSVVPAEKPEWVKRAWTRINEEVAAGHQAYVVCPRIEGEGGVLEVHKNLQEFIYPHLRIGMLHGRMDSDLKDEVMQDFAAGNIDVLVSTTVIEVGIDVANATVMLIMEADRFGVSQIHQLRGRVGRGGFASLCLLYTQFAITSPQMERLQAIAQTSDGFALSELDLQVRQEGDILGTSQSGSDTKLLYLSLLTDQKIIERALKDAAELVERDPGRALALVSDIALSNQDYLEKS